VRRLLPFLLPGAVLLVWELAAQSGTISRIVCPSLGAVARELGTFVLRGERLVEAWSSLYRALTGFALAALAGVPLGLAIGRWHRAARIVEPVLSATYPVPKIALFPVLVFALGIGSLSKISLVFLECLYPIVINAAQGARAVNRVLVWSSANMGAARLQILRKIVLPAAAPAIFTGFRVALPVALVVVIITEMIGSADGLGYFVMAALADLRTDRLLAAVVVTATLGWALDWLVVAARAQLVFWERHETHFN
jgi:ABC-type nitrate/sulfonate/bicarbonate transport system permease component